MTTGWAGAGVARRVMVVAVMAAALLPGLLLGVAIWGGADGLLTHGGDMLVVRDYMWVWGGGHFIADGRMDLVRSPELFNAAMRARFGAGLEEQHWTYPPSMLFLLVPAGYLGLLPGYALFVALQAGLVAAVGRLVAPACWLGALALLASPAFVENALGGQNGGITGPLLVAGLLLAPRRPVLAGVLFGLLTIKPQIGLLVPVALLASRNWRAILAAMVTTALLVLASGLAFGWESWAAFWELLHGQAARILDAPWHGLFYQRMMVTPFVMLRGFGVGPSTAYALQTGVLAVCALCVGVLWWRKVRDHRLRVAATVVLGLLATPYGYTYDMVGIAAAVLLAVQAGLLWSEGPGTRWALAAAWAWPGIPLGLLVIGYLPAWPPLLATPVLVAFAGVLLLAGRGSGERMA